MIPGVFIFGLLAVATYPKLAPVCVVLAVFALPKALRWLGRAR